MRRAFHANYYALYSSVYGGIVTDPALMMIPIDDHMVHRGDGVFEVFKCVNGNLYNLDAHLRRLRHSAVALHHRMPCSLAAMAGIVKETVRAGGQRNCSVHLFVSRGPGSFSVNPYECPRSQLYVVVIRLNRPFMELHPRGARVRSSSVPVKPPCFAEVKSCNYLPNVLMKKEAVDLKVDFVAGFDDRGFLTEGASENLGIVTKRGALLFPRLEYILAGTTMLRVMELARGLVKSGDLTHVGFDNVGRKDIRNAAEMLIVGTTHNVAAVREFDGKRIGDGKPGPVYAKLNALFLNDLHHNAKALTPVFG